MVKIKILLVDDDSTFTDMASKALKGEGYSVQVVTNAEDAMKKIAKGLYNIVITDIILPGTDGLKLLEKVKSESPSSDVIFCTSYSGVESAVKALKSGAYDYLTRPIDAAQLVFAVKRCLEQRAIYSENKELKSMMELIDTCKNISATFDKNKIAKYSLDILMKETKASSGFFIAKNEENGENFEAVYSKGINTSKNKNLLELFFQMTKKWKKNKNSLFALSDNELCMIRNHYKTVNDGVLIKVKVKSAVKAYIVLLNNVKRGEFAPEDIKNSDFIIKETSLAFTNLEQYIDAKELAYIDDLSGLYNSRYLYLILDRELKRSKRFKASLVVLFIDLDNLKRINDEHGHLVGGKVLKEMASVLIDCVREIDTIVRYGGDEYIVVLTETNIPAGRMVAERIRQHIEKHVFLKEEKLNIKLTACIGLAAYPKHASTKKELIHFADMAMYMGKETTKNAVYIAAERLK